MKKKSSFKDIKYHLLAENEGKVESRGVCRTVSYSGDVGLEILHCPPLLSRDFSVTSFGKFCNQNLIRSAF